MPHLEKSPDGRSYTIDGRPLTPEEPIELHILGQWHPGKFDVTEALRPYFFAARFACQIGPADEVRWAETFPNSPPMAGSSAPDAPAMRATQENAC